MKSSRKLRVSVLVSILAVLVVLFYIIMTPLYLEYTIKNNFSKNTVEFEKLINYYKSLYPIYVYFHSKYEIDMLIRKPNSEFDTYLDLYNINLENPKVLSGLKSVNISPQQIETLYYLLDKVNCNSIGISPNLYRNRDVIEISFYRSFWFYSWNYLFFKEPVSENYIRMNSLYGGNYYSINDTIGWGNVK